VSFLAEPFLGENKKGEGRRKDEMARKGKLRPAWRKKRGLEMGRI